MLASVCVGQEGSRDCRHIAAICAPSAGLMSADFLQKFIQGNPSLTITEQMDRTDRAGSVSVLPELSGEDSLGCVCWSRA